MSKHGPKRALKGGGLSSLIPPGFWGVLVGLRWGILGGSGGDSGGDSGEILKDSGAILLVFIVKMLPLRPKASNHRGAGEDVAGQKL